MWDDMLLLPKLGKLFCLWTRLWSFGEQLLSIFTKQYNKGRGSECRLCRPIALSPQPKLRRPSIEVVSPQHRNCIAPSKKSNSNCVLWSLLICHGSISFNDRSNTNNSSYFGIFCNSWNKACYKRWSVITFNKPFPQKILPDLCSCWSSVKGIAGNGENLYKFQVLTSQATCFSKARCTSSTS